MHVAQGDRAVLGGRSGRPPGAGSSSFRSDRCTLAMPASLRAARTGSVDARRDRGGFLRCSAGFGVPVVFDACAVPPEAARARRRHHALFRAAFRRPPTRSAVRRRVVVGVVWWARWSGRRGLRRRRVVFDVGVVVDHSGGRRAGVVCRGLGCRAVAASAGRRVRAGRRCRRAAAGWAAAAEPAAGGAARAEGGGRSGRSCSASMGEVPLAVRVRPDQDGNTCCRSGCRRDAV